MFILDSLMISGIRWALETALTAAEAEMNDDSVLREQLIEAELRREMGEISDEEFADIEADLLARIREIKQRREGGSGPLAFTGAEAIGADAGDQFTIEASISGDFHDPAAAPHTKVIDARSDFIEEVAILDMEPGDAALPAPAPPEGRRRASRQPLRAARGSRTRRATAASRRTRPTRK